MMENYYLDYKAGSAGLIGNFEGTPALSYTGYYGWACAACGQWVPGDSVHICYSTWPSYGYYHFDKTEKAYAILKKLVGKGIIQEPKFYKDFCDLLDGVKETL